MKVTKFIVELLRLNLIRGNKVRRKKFPPLNLFRNKLGISYLNDNEENHKLDVFYAKNSCGICLIDIHGGSYVFGHRHDNYNFVLQFIEKGFDVVALDYVPCDGKKRVVKDSLDDCYKALRYLFDHIKELELDNDKFIIMGDSAGGHFALSLAEANDDEEYAKLLGYDFSNINLEAVMVNCPVYDYPHVGDKLMSKSGKKRLFGPNYIDIDALRLISPKDHIKSLKMPLFFSTCLKDFLREQSLMLEKDLKEEGRTINFIDIYSKNRNIQHVHNVLNVDVNESVQVNVAMMTFAHEILKR